MAKKSSMVRALRDAKFTARQHNRCPLCGRSKAFLRDFNMCRICFRTRALRGELPGVMKASW